MPEHPGGEVVVTCATSSVGRELTRLLLEFGREVRALVRDLDVAGASFGPELFCGDMSRAADVDRALAGVRHAFIQVPDDNVEALASGAARAGVEHVVLLSSFSTVIELPSGDANCIRARYRSAERALTKARLPSTFLRCAPFSDELLRWTEAMAEGVVRAPFPDVPIALVHPADVAASAAAVLVSSMLEPAAYVLTGPEQISMRQAVEVLGTSLGRGLSLQELSLDDALGRFPAETSDLVRRSLLETLGEAASGLAPTDDVEHLTGKPARTFLDWATDHAAQFAHTGHAPDVDRR